jgi:hypothetical protein
VAEPVDDHPLVKLAKLQGEILVAEAELEGARAKLAATTDLLDAYRNLMWKLADIRNPRASNSETLTNGPDRSHLVADDRAGRQCSGRADGRWPRGHA